MILVVSGVSLTLIFISCFMHTCSSVSRKTISLLRRTRQLSTSLSSENDYKGVGDKYRIDHCVAGCMTRYLPWEKLSSAEAKEVPRAKPEVLSRLPREIIFPKVDSR